MTIPGKDRQRKYKEKLRALKKKAVAVDLSKKAYEILARKQEDTGRSYAAIINEALCNSSNLGEENNNGPMCVDQDWEAIRTHLDNLKRKHMDEHSRFDRKMLQEFRTEGRSEKSYDSFERYFKDILKHSYDTIYRYNFIDDRFDYISASSIKDLAISLEELKSIHPDTLLAEYIHPDDLLKVIAHFDLSRVKRQENISPMIEFRGKVGKGGEYRWLCDTHRLLFGKDNKPVAMIGNTRDITESKHMEDALRNLIDKLERKVTDYASNLEQTNTALKILLKKYEEEKKAIEDNMLFNINELVHPILEKLQTGKLSGSQEKYIQLLESVLNKIVSPFSNRLASKYLSLSHVEIQVANYVLHGKTTKEIAELMCLSDRTIDFHRTSIRKKIGLTNKKVSLRSHLLSLD